MSFSGSKSKVNIFEKTACSDLTILADSKVFRPTGSVGLP